jgi:hypothetical protein
MPRFECWLSVSGSQIDIVEAVDEEDAERRRCQRRGSRRQARPLPRRCRVHRAEIDQRIRMNEEALRALLASQSMTMGEHGPLP